MAVLFPLLKLTRKKINIFLWFLIFRFFIYFFRFQHFSDISWTISNNVIQHLILQLRQSHYKMCQASLLCDNNCCLSRFVPTWSWDIRLLIHEGNGFRTPFGKEIIKSSELFNMETNAETHVSTLLA